jgi:hypothetical protein
MVNIAVLPFLTYKKLKKPTFMKRKLLLLTAVTAIVAASAIQNQLTSKPEGALAAIAADPASGFTDCTDCQSGTTSRVSNWKTTNITAAGYSPGQNYLITATRIYNAITYWKLKYNWNSKLLSKS